jgi:hypothetical protein
MRDMVRKGRHACGTKIWTNKLSPDQVREIYRRRMAGETITALGREFGIHHSHVSSIALRQAWRSLIEPANSQRQ